MASVTFPTALGGDGKTYTDDAHPDTGLDGLGHVTRFVPCLKNVVAMAGYTAQYAAKIDAAATYADRAEDAKRYVEAVAEAYAVNLLDAYRDRITLGADFRAGRYTRDDGARLDTNDPSLIFSIVRSTPKFLEASNQYLREYAPDVVAREWNKGKPLGAVIEPTSQNLLVYSEDFSGSGWVIATSMGDIKDGLASWLNKPYMRYDNFTFSGSLSILQNITVSSGQAVTLSAYVSNETTPRYLAFNMGNDFRVVVDTENEVISSNPAGVSAALFVRKTLNGRRFCLTVTLPTTQNRFGVFFRKSNSVGYNDNWIPGDVIALTAMQLEIGDKATSYIPTLDSSVTRQSDQLFRISEGQFSRQQGTFYAQYLKPPGGFDYILGLGTANDEEINLGNSSARSTFINLRSGGEFSSINAASLQSQIGELEKALFTYVFNGTSYIFELFVNGGFAGTGELTRLPAGFENNIAIGRRRANFNDLHANTNIFGFFYIPLQLSRAEAQELTTL
ncbi:phage head spike fiber domain-containing protein [Halomonas sp. C22]|uniref:phage head spike fiber domain-containing protein n=1 Tax=Halomonas sp. C22 TaxID=2580567 RepID=UPI00119D43D9|nr:hypothetical protein [Halomonas sp. C22]